MRSIQAFGMREATNEILDSSGLYITHLFRSDQVFLRSDWEKHLVSITRPQTTRLQLFRPATLDLILTKMMRGEDAQDLADIRFMVQHDKITTAQVESAFSAVVLPEMIELRDAFKRAQPCVRKIVQDAELNRF